MPVWRSHPIARFAIAAQVTRIGPGEPPHRRRLALSESSGPAWPCTGQAVLDAVRAQPWDVLILDSKMPGRSGLEIIPELRHSAPTLPILILTVHGEEQLARRLLKSGVAG
jgi:DNA-binding NarL/FixJ family response regulator